MTYDPDDLWAVWSWSGDTPSLSKVCTSEEEANRAREGILAELRAYVASHPWLVIPVYKVDLLSSFLYELANAARLTLDSEDF